MQESLAAVVLTCSCCGLDRQGFDVVSGPSRNSSSVGTVSSYVSISLVGRVSRNHLRPPTEWADTAGRGHRCK